MHQRCGGESAPGRLPPVCPRRALYSLDDANGADATALSAGSFLWEVPLELTRRTLLPDGRLRSTWRPVLLSPSATPLFYRFRTPRPGPVKPRRQVRGFLDQRIQAGRESTGVLAFPRPPS